MSVTMRTSFAMDTPSRTRTYRNQHLDSTRWDHVRLRAGDVVVTTSLKSGTTWMQRIVSLLLFGPGPLPVSLGTISPWIDSAFGGDIESVVESSVLDDEMLDQGDSATDARADSALVPAADGAATASAP